MAVGGKIIEEEDVCQIFGWWVVSIGERKTKSKGYCVQRDRLGSEKIFGGGRATFSLCFHMKQTLVFACATPKQGPIPG